MILRQSRLLGAAVVGAALLIAAATNVWMMLSPAARGGPAVSDAFFLGLALYLVTALGMQLMTFEDMTLELKSANANLESAQIELRQMVVTDALTGLRNRRFFDEVIGRELSLHRRYGTPLSVLFLDIDRFKAINDTLGHAAGDRTLQRGGGVPAAEDPRRRLRVPVGRRRVPAAAVVPRGRSAAARSGAAERVSRDRRRRRCRVASGSASAAPRCHRWPTP